MQHSLGEDYTSGEIRGVMNYIEEAQKMNIKFRDATIDDLALLRNWDEQPHVIACDPNDDWEWETDLKIRSEWREQLIAEIDGRPLGFVQIIDPLHEESHYWGDVPEHLRAIDIWIGEGKDLSKGFGTRMMTLAIERCFAAADVTAILIDPLESNVRSHIFYERLGFVFVEKRKFGQDECFVYRLERKNWEKARK